MLHVVRAVRSPAVRSLASRALATQAHASANWSRLPPVSRLPVALAAVGATAAFLALHSDSTRCDAPAAPVGGARKPGLPTYTAADVAAHSSPETGVWVTFNWGVYDITEFIASHPGGKHKIALASGGSVAAFWDVYRQHLTPEVQEVLEELRIGNLDELPPPPARPTEGPYAAEPERHPSFVVHSAQPFNAEPPMTLLGDYITPSALFYVRNHMPVPVVDAEAYRLSVVFPSPSGEGERVVQLSLADLKNSFQKREVTVTMQCGGNRREDLANVEGKTVKGLKWRGAAIGNAQWAGASLREVLEASGATAAEIEACFVHFEGLDKDMEGAPYASSISGEKAADPKGDVILAYEMNGEELPRDHGYPIRVIIPGVMGGRSIKWLDRVVLSASDSTSHWQTRDYKCFAPGVSAKEVDWSSAPAIQETPVQSAITSPAAGTRVAPGEAVTVSGYAYSGGGRAIIRVDVSLDGGETWQVAELDEDASKQPLNRAWAWTPWETTITVPADAKEDAVLVCKAVDASYNTQPFDAAPIWNMRGLLSTAWHRVPVKVSA